MDNPTTDTNQPLETTNTETSTDNTETQNPSPDNTITPTDETAQLRETLARAQADYQNLLMRVERDRTDMAAYLSTKILLPLLSQVDNLERAVKLKEGTEGDTFVDGVRSVLAGMEKYLESQGVKAFISLGQEVDPDKHDVMTQGAGASGIIVSEFERGYMIGDRVLRHAKVIVGNGEIPE